VRALGVAYPLLTAVVVVATANHYVLDVVAGVLVIAGPAALLAAAGTVIRDRRVPGPGSRRIEHRGATCRPPWPGFEC
jgi:hypothetical protein